MAIFISYNVINQVIGPVTGPRSAVLARGEAEGQYS